MKKNIFVILFILLVMAGCSQNNIEIGNQVKETNVRINNQLILNWLKIDDVNSVKRKNNLIKVSLNVYNSSTFSRNLAYKINWYDEDHMPIKTILSKWKVEEINGQNNFVIYGISPSSKSNYFEIVLDLPADDSFLSIDKMMMNTEKN